MAQAIALRPDQAGRRVLVAHRVVDAGEVDGVLDTAHQHRLLVVGRVRVAPTRQGWAGAVAAGQLRVEDQLRPAHGRPPRRLGVAPPFVTDRDPERHAVDLEEPPLAVGHVVRGLLEGDLVLGLVAGYRAVAP